eukprot:CAMPEP_0202454702 /NCGR_PEP_ID=MMETSP1360-20130828/12368_1 /ASSEMBLY_ACC=CAM_ASM_000848 /TAXON_ID=515479 /ORGANISM="Licmophora paradoxa, Strain CCMP2313" /LENGTH=389 /DNA_ID=CAMNT_0049074085 /DNA_START=27 /DNA_END=1196 /DNA_ORIENTATION=+
MFTVADFVKDVPTKANEFPTLRSSLIPVLLLSLLTSVFGFSVGPEAPMVASGGLIGAALSRRWYGDADKERATVLAYAGAAGALTASMGIPIAGSIFALEMTRSSAGVSNGARKGLSACVMASLGALALLRFVLAPTEAAGGQFDYGVVGALTGRGSLFIALGAGVLGAVIGRIFTVVVLSLKSLFWSVGAPKVKDGTKGAWKRQVLVKTALGLCVGLIGTFLPQTLFWGEGTLQSVIDGHQTALDATHHGLARWLTNNAIINPSIPFTGSFVSGLTLFAGKLGAIALACAGKFPGGVIFPLFFAAAPLAHGLANFSPSLPVLVMSLMSATQASVTRTPLASALILGLLSSKSTELSAILPTAIVASYISVWVSQLLSKTTYFAYSDSK